jgi:hypothetical protein
MPLALLFKHYLSSIQIISTRKLPGRISIQVTIARGTEASQLGMSSGLQQHPQLLKQSRTLIATSENR